VASVDGKVIKIMEGKFAVEWKRELERRRQQLEARECSDEG
jgi:hypothetical protein